MYTHVQKVYTSALRRAVKYGNGFFGAGSSTTKQFAEQVPIVRQALAEAGRDAASFKIAKRVYIAVDNDAQRAPANWRVVAATLLLLRVERPGAGRGLRATRRLRARSARGGRGRRGADPAQSSLRRGRADGAPGGRGRAQALVMLLEDGGLEADGKTIEMKGCALYM